MAAASFIFAMLAAAEGAAAIASVSVVAVSIDFRTEVLVAASLGPQKSAVSLSHDLIYTFSDLHGHQDSDLRY